jgi:mitochondrial import inner membrane translocase subunit TIM44
LESLISSNFIQISRASSAVSSAVEKSTEPIRNTTAYKTLAETVVDALDDSGSAKHAGFEEKEARRLRRQKRLVKAGRNAGLGPNHIVADPEYVRYSSPFSLDADFLLGIGQGQH